MLMEKFLPWFIQDELIARAGHVLPSHDTSMTPAMF